MVEQEVHDRIVSTDAAWAKVLFAYANGDGILSGDYRSNPTWIVDFGDSDLFTASRHKAALEHVRASVLSDWQRNADAEREKTGKTSGEHQKRVATWWRLKRRRAELLSTVAPLGRYISCSRVTKRPIFWFMSAQVHADSALAVFALNDDYSFGVISSQTFWNWIVAKGSSLEGRTRFTPDTAFISFPWPQSVTLAQARAVADAARALRQLRERLQTENDWSLRALYRVAEQPGSNPIKDAHAALDRAVRDAYGMGKRDQDLNFLLDLNHAVAAKEDAMERPVGPGLPPCVKRRDEFISDDCIAAW